MQAQKYIKTDYAFDYYFEQDNDDRTKSPSSDNSSDSEEEEGEEDEEEKSSVTVKGKPGENLQCKDPSLSSNKTDTAKAGGSSTKRWEISCDDDQH